MSIATLAPPPCDASPLDPSHHRELADAAKRAEPLRRAARVANFHAWTTAILAGLSAPFALFNMTGYAVFAALSLVAFNEFRGRRRLLEFDPAGATILAWNQLLLFALVTIYCVWMISTNLTASGELVDQLRVMPEAQEVFQDFGGLDAFWRALVFAVYGTVIAASAVFQGANALYYLSRRKYVEAYVRETPEWIRDVRANA